MRAKWLALLGLACALTACGRDEPPRPQTSHIEIDADVVRERRALPDPAAPEWKLEGTWTETEVREAWTSTPGEPISVPITQTGAIDVTTAVALRGPPGADRDDVSVDFDVDLKRGEHEERLALVTVTAHDAVHSWREVHAHAQVAAGDDARLVLRSRLRAPPGADVSAVQACWSVPRVDASVRSRLNVLIIAVDTLRADHVTSLGYARPTTPNIDALFARGVRFDEAIATAPWTLPSFGSVFTGLYPARHRAGVSTSREAAFGDGRAVPNGDFESLAPGCTTLAERFRDAGFATAGIVSNPYFVDGARIESGFSSWAQYLNRASAGVELAQRWITAQGDDPWFLFLHLFDPHAPYVPPAPYDQQFANRSVASIPGWPPTVESMRAHVPDAATKKLALDLYDAEIAYTDAQIGALIAFLDARHDMERTLVVLLADHGEELWDHGGYEHGHTLNEELLHVPLAFVMPGKLPPGGQITQRTSLVDVCPTILELCGLPAIAGIDGISLLPLLEGRPMPERPCISESPLYGPREQKAWSTDDEKLVTDGAGVTHLYRLPEDRTEMHDLALARPERVRALREELVARWKHLLGGVKGQPAWYDRRRRADFEKLGYPGAAAAPAPRK